jgi:hypothetical protein
MQSLSAGVRPFCCPWFVVAHLSFVVVAAATRTALANPTVWIALLGQPRTFKAPQSARHVRRCCVEARFLTLPCLLLIFIDAGRAGSFSNSTGAKLCTDCPSASYQVRRLGSSTMGSC